MSVRPDVISTTTSRPAQRKILLAASIGQFVEFYDFAVYGFSIVIIAAFYFPSGDPVIGVLSAFAVYGVAFVVRPLGGLFFGSLGDRIGRKTILTISLLTIGVATTLIGFLPTYEQVGVLAPILLVALRLVQGFSAGGEAVGAPSFVLEHAPRERRASWINVTIATTALSSVAAALVVAAVSGAMSDAAFQEWGWRIPFFLAAPMSIIGLYIRSKTEETPAFKELEAMAADRPAPVKAAFASQKRRMLQVFLIMSLPALGYYVLVGYFVTYMQSVIHIDRGQALISNSVALLGYAVMMYLGGRLSDRVGRKKMMIAGAIGMVLLAWPAFLLVGSGEFGLAIVGQLLLSVPICVFGGGSFTFYVELFPTATRLTGAAVSYNLSYGLFGGTGPLIATALVAASGSAISPAFYLIAIGVVAGITALFVPETRGRDLMNAVTDDAR
ncbi:MFS transporter [Microbacterium hibisci]|uniref:MFS transporter n=1 Tax=Microbacterium hibisci TaxID=2036000 RepID=UPI001944B309|nr:MFS transporter [Microbacterium hibisci]